MAVNEADDVLTRAAQELREEPEHGWDDFAGSVLTAVRTTARRTVAVHARPVADDEAAGHRLTVADAVLVRLVARAVEQVPGLAPARVRLHLQERACIGAQVHVVARYGTVLETAGDAARAATERVLDETLGPVADTAAPRVVDVVVDDVVLDERSL